MLVNIELIEDYQKETQASYTDGLTGLYNFGFFRIILDREVKRAERHGEPFTLALIGVDSLTFYNKNFGTVKGDRALNLIAGVVNENIRQIDLAARYSGDVVALLLTKSTTESSLEVGERIRRQIEKKFNQNPTVSIGFASYPKDAVSPEALIRAAEKALSQAKTSGKNRIFCFEKRMSASSNISPHILIVDDEPRNLKLMEALLEPLNYQIFKASNGIDALSIVKKVSVDLIILDIMMPGMDGYEVCRRLKSSEETRLIPVIMLTALDDIDAKVKGLKAGADEFLTKYPDKVELITRIKAFTRVKALNDNLASIENVLFSLVNAVEAKDAYTRGHTKRVANLAIKLGERMELLQNEREALRIGGMLHDIGKIGISAEILNKPGPLMPEEYQVMRKHPEEGYKICLPLQKNLGTSLEIIRHHHEKLDGSGYPDGLKEEEISMPIRIMAVADIYDALITDRPYRRSISKEGAFDILLEEAKEGKLDTQVVEHLIGVVG